MPYDPLRHHRRSIRLRGHDYASPSAYFVTVCVHRRLCLLGAIQRSALLLNDAGAMVRAQWEALPQRFPTLLLDPAFVVMPNHFHAIATLAPPQSSAPTLGAIIGAFKSLTTTAYLRGVADHGWPPFEQRLWQRNYYERIIRDAAALARIRAYIQTNPCRWEDDTLRPSAPPNRFNQE